ncbi:hypothetical protein LRL17_11475 [Rhodococcus qingshengii]|uniref:hypothetical protein n=1 Tax=Rhodococcus qingshengii TaxID=334542 RepID=UPI001E4448E1|nr:hypothetical protein [Rhodococcus qingshengii]UGQ54258.1 hypothetical protein LRL17_11475 [Rhodococcus qingshengii]
MSLIPAQPNTWFCFDTRKASTPNDCSSDKYEQVPVIGYSEDDVLILPGNHPVWAKNLSAHLESRGRLLVGGNDDDGRPSAFITTVTGKDEDEWNS